ncbi:MAG: trypsin-like peptidase domain-containing protein [Bacilli bacterium]|nr:trypsin-like peptidase domain-containing protein [Bacilli bacterium]
MHHRLGFSLIFFLVGCSAPVTEEQPKYIFHQYDNTPSSLLSSGEQHKEDVNHETSEEPRAVIGDDDRQTIDVGLYQSYPYRAICSLKVTWDDNGDGIMDGTTWGTGFFVGPRVVLTCCHVVYNGTTWGNVSVRPGHRNISGLDASENNPYGSLPVSYTIIGNYNSTHNVNDDWAILRLASTNSLGFQIGYFPMSDRIYQSDSVMVAGYSGDYPGQITYGRGVISTLQTYQFSHTCDMIGGASGAPVLINEGIAVGINAAEDVSGSMNYACRITSYIISWVKEVNDENVFPPLS